MRQPIPAQLASRRWLGGGPAALAVLVLATLGACSSGSAGSSSAAQLTGSTAVGSTPYEATHDSLASHPLPDWYQDAKFGIMIHYGLYSVPGWAPLFDPTGQVFTPAFFKNNPYAEWYLNTMQIPGSPTQLHHLAKYGKDASYDQFATAFNTGSQTWDPDAWTRLFEAAGARYAVLTTKHHDGFLLWPSAYANPAKPGYRAERDIVGDFVASLRRSRGKNPMKVGLYYSGGYDWSWASAVSGPIVDPATALAKVPQQQAYADYVTNQWEELIQRYKPELLWNDIGLPKGVDKFGLFADYYNLMEGGEGGVVNNRWEQGSLDFTWLGQPADSLLDIQLLTDWFDYYSPEYLPSYAQTTHKWEADHSPSWSFGYNQNDFVGTGNLKSAEAVIVDLADVVSKNGNLLLGVGPEADGSIPSPVQTLLRAVGAWLGRNGEAIYATRAWTQAVGSANGNASAIATRATVSKDGRALYLILLSNPGGQDVLLDDLQVTGSGVTVQVVNGAKPIPVAWVQQGEQVKVSLSGTSGVPAKLPLVLKLVPATAFRRITGR